ncbi:2-phospho-L-lactate transferase CofD family protein [Nocardioides solisilvae]|uniref:2-phospho-L-lactate transferase CofD family protein n=1 Tax=Nocardioides solisilvae TaxID=1542435 RepID=UPI0013A5B6B5|nr:2-phospho-L-lactate transferase CofD family protein [Nocardioides solisilvae]
MRDVTVLSGGMGGARFTRGLVRVLTDGAFPGLDSAPTVTAVASTGGDLWVHGLKVCGHLDSLMAPSPAAAPASRTVHDELAAYGVEPAWFPLDDRGVATHLVRTEMLEAGYPLSAVTEALCRRWQPGLRLLPATDDRVETHVAVADPKAPSGRRVVHVQEYVERLRGGVPAETVLHVGLDAATPAPGVAEALSGADLVLLAPDDPVAGLGPLLGVPGVREALAGTPARVVGLSPVATGTAAPAVGHLLAAAELPADAAGLGLHLGPRAAGGLLDGWVVDEADAGLADRLSAGGLPTAVAPLAALLRDDLDALDDPDDPDDRGRPDPSAVDAAVRGVLAAVLGPLGPRG